MTDRHGSSSTLPSSTLLSSTLLLLADGRLPTGGHAHSGGLEEATVSGRVRTAADLCAWLTGRLATAGRVDAQMAAGTAAHGAIVMDAEAAARCPSPALRRASRAQGRGLLRAGRRMWPSPFLDEDPRWHGDGLMAAVALGVVGMAAGAGVPQVALVAAHSAVSGPGWAATRLLGLDPFAVGAVLARLAGAIDEVAAGAAASARDDPAQLDAHGAPLTEIGAEAHAGWEVRLFAS